MRRSLLVGAGCVLLLIGIGILESILLHPLPSAAPDQRHVQDVIAQLQFTAQESSEDTLLHQLAAGDAPPLHTLVLLAENDRSALLSWIESKDAGSYFSALKEALSSTFSPDLQDLRDDREELPGNRTREILSFRDRALSTERITIVRTGNFLYEFHISPGHDERLAPLIEALSR